MNSEHTKLERDIQRIDDRLTKHIDIYQQNGKEIARMAQELKDTKITINDRLDTIYDLIESNRHMIERQGKKYASKSDLAPVKMLAFGGAGIILSGAVAAMMAVIFI